MSTAGDRPCGMVWDACAGLPIGMQLMGKAWGEADIIFAASVLEAALKDTMRLPQVVYDPLHGGK